MARSEAEELLSAAWREESVRIIARLSRLTRDVALAEDLAQEALLIAIEQWPRTGVPERPGAWLLTTAKRRALNWFRHQRTTAEKQPALLHEMESDRESEEEALQRVLDSDVADDALRLLFVACHTLLGREARVALTLRMVGGLQTPEIARAFLTREATMAQRIVRAKKVLSDAGAKFELPPSGELGERLASVLEVIYLVFNEGYAPSSGEQVQRVDLQAEARRLARLLAELCPDEPEALALAALLELQSSRESARVDALGEAVLLLEQDRELWDRGAIERGLAWLERARGLAGVCGPYGYQAEIAACHARALRPEDTDWERIAELYAQLADLHPSPVLTLNRALALAQARGPAAGLELLDTLLGLPALEQYHWLPSARAELLERLGRREEAQLEFERAAALTENQRQRGRLLARAARAGSPTEG